jgi:hypothetical protein
MPDTIQRKWITTTVALHATLGSCGVLDIRNYAGLSIKIPASVTVLTFNGCETADGSFLPIHDNTNAALAPSVTASKWFDVPSAVFAHGFLRIQSTGANATATVVLKG